MITDIKNLETKEKISFRIGFNYYEVYDKDKDTTYSARISTKTILRFYLNEYTSLNNELNLLPSLHHPSISKYINFSLNGIKDNYFPTLITEYAQKGPLNKIIYQNTIKLTPTNELIIIYGVASGMSYLHSNEILHCDLKLSNVWLDDRLFPKITGFNVSEKIESNNKIKTKMIIKGSPAYLAPEIYLEKCRNKSSDVYSFSLFVYELLMKEKPYQEFKDIKEIRDNVALKNQRPKFDKKISEPYRLLIEKCWSQDPNERLKFDEILNELENNSNFITDEINDEEYRNYIQFTKESKKNSQLITEMPKLDDVSKEYSIEEFEISNKFKGNYETETNNLSYFLKYLNENNYRKNKKKTIKSTSAIIYVCSDKKTDKEYAFKTTYEKTSKHHKQLAISLGQYFFLDHPCIIEFFGYFIITVKVTYVLKYYKNGNLHNLIKSKKKLDDTQKLIIIYGIVSGMLYLHSLDIIHRNLKVENVLLDDNLFPKICDCKPYLTTDYSFTPPGNVNQNMIITPPELLNDYEKYNRTKSVDVYSFAFILYEIVTNEEPYDADVSPIIIVEKTKKGQRPEFKNPVPNAYKKLIEKCWSQDPEKRPTFEYILNELETNQEFITENIDKERYRKYIEYVKKSEISKKKEEKDEDKKLEKEEEKDEDKELEKEEEKDEEEEKYEISLNSTQIDLNKFKKIKNSIGQGSFGKVYKCLNKESNEIQACKISIRTLNSYDNEHLICIERELNILSELNFPSILKFVGYSLHNFKNESRPTIITELVSHKSLDNIIEREKNGFAAKEWTDTKKLIIIYGIAIGMSYIHSKDILHRDLKSANIFIDDYFFPKIGDFGLSKKIQQETKKERFVKVSKQRGTYAYMSPEILYNNEYLKAGDVYSYAFIVYEIMSCKIAYEEFNLYEVFNLLLEGRRPDIEENIPKCYRELIENCWKSDPEQRPTFDEIVFDLKNNPEFIIDTVDQDEFYKYVDYIDSFTSTPKEFQQEQETFLNKTFQKVSIDLLSTYDSYDVDPSLKDFFLNINCFDKGEMIKSEPTYKLYQVKHKETAQIYSAKIITIKLNKMSQHEIINLSREINNLSQIKHPSILKFIGYSLTDFSGKNRPVIVTEYSSNLTMSTILEQERKGKKILNWDDTQKLINIYGIAVGMKFLHSHNILHRDLTLESIFLDNNLYPKISNFGLSTHFHTQKSMTFQSTLGVKGNPVYSAPEVLSGNEYLKSSDVYSFGLLVYSIMTNKIPYENISNLHNLLNEICVKSSRPELNKEKIGNSYRQLIEICWSQNCNDRPSFEDIVDILNKEESSFITNKVDKDEYTSYKKYIESSKIEFYSNVKIIKQEELLKANGKIKEIQQESTEEKTKQESNNINKDENENKINEIEESIEEHTMNSNENNTMNKSDSNENKIIEQEESNIEDYNPANKIIEQEESK